MVRKKARRVDDEACVACDACAEVCPQSHASEFDNGIAERKAIYMPFPQAVPNAYLIDAATCTYVQSDGKKCGACAKKCPKECIDLDPKDEIIECRGRQHHPRHRLRRLRRHQDRALRLRRRPQRAHGARVRAADQRVGTHRRQDRHQDASATTSARRPTSGSSTPRGDRRSASRSSTAWARATPTTTPTARASAACTR